MKENETPRLDLEKIKETVRQESARLNLSLFIHDNSESYFTLVMALTAAVKKVFYEKSSTTFSSEPKLDKKPITQFVHRMRIDAMEKFNTTTVFSVIYFAASEEGLKKQEYQVTLIVYLEQDYMPDFLRLMQYPYIYSEDEAELKDGCGALVNLIAGQFKNEMAKLGYKDFMMSHFESYINTAVDGVGIPKGLGEKYELSFEVEGAKRLVIELASLGVLPKWSAEEKKGFKKILIIDDDRGYAKQMEAFLLSHGYKVLVAHNGKEGIALLKENPDLIILDLQMPIMDGYEFILAMKEIAGKIQLPVLVMTAEQGLGDIVNVQGIKEYVIKPFQPDALLKSIQRFI